MSDWMTIRFELLGRNGDPLPVPPGRVLLAHPDHVLGELADAVDSAFGRWDLTPVSEFTIDGRRAVPGGDDDDPEALDSDTCRLGDLGWEVGSHFSYTFDLGEGWEHECRVEEVGVEAGVEADQPDLPVPVFGWGVIPDQYGRDAEDDEGDDEDEDDDFLDDDEYVDSSEPGDTIDFDLVADALPEWELAPPAEQLQVVAARLRTEATLGLPPYDVLFDASDLEPGNLPADDAVLWTRLAGSVIQPQTSVPQDPAAEAVWTTLEAADWAGLIIGLVRGDVGQSAEPEALAHLIATVPDVATDPLVGEDREAVIDALDTVAGWWQALGIVDDERRLTALGRWGLPLALETAWA